jgi:hypothetical protein
MAEVGQEESWQEQLHNRLLKTDIAEVVFVVGAPGRERLNFLRFLRSKKYGSRYCIVDDPTECTTWNEAMEVLKKSDKKDFVIDAIMFGEKNQPTCGEIYQIANLTRAEGKPLTVVVFSEDPTLRSTPGYARVYKVTDAGFVII